MIILVLSNKRFLFAPRQSLNESKLCETLKRVPRFVFLFQISLVTVVETVLMYDVHLPNVASGTCKVPSSSVGWEAVVIGVH
jgi:hypothetical protein